MATDLTQEFCALRDTYIEKQFGRLNEMQRRAVFTTDGPLLILAGAGSGKTTVLVNRIANLIRFGAAHGSKQLPRPATEEDVKALRSAIMTGTAAPGWLDGMLRQNAVRSWNVMAITFTNKAAGEMKERLRRMLGGEEGDEVFASTFHSACVRILRRWAEEIGYPRSFTIYDTDDAQRVMKAVYKDLNVDDKFFPIKSAINQMSRWKDQLVSPEQALANPAKDTKGALAARIYAAYEKRLKEAGAFDFDDLLLYAFLLLKNHEDVRSAYQSRFRYIMVDEYQDTNHAQYSITGLLAEGHKNIMVVGDDDQSIYSWRGADLRNILEFEQDYPSAHTVKLEQNYRSVGNVLAAANAVIANNQHRKAKKLFTSAEDGDKIQVYMAADERDEGRWIAGEIEKQRAAGLSYNQVAVFYRTNAQSRMLEDMLLRAGVPYRIVGGTRFFDRAEIRDVMAYLTLVVNPADDIAAKRVINVPRRGIGKTTIERIEQFAREMGMTFMEGAELAIVDPELRASARQAIGEFVGLINEARTYGGDLRKVIEMIIDKSGLIGALQAENTDEARGRIENIQEFLGVVDEFTETHEDEDAMYEAPTAGGAELADEEAAPAFSAPADAPAGSFYAFAGANELAKASEDSPVRVLRGDSLADFIEWVRLRTDLDTVAEDGHAVTMMTVHSSKGLEFDCVFVAGMEETLFPHMNSVGDAAGIEEERRLAYVAITRARKKLFLTCAYARQIFGQTSSNPISRFVQEIPSELRQTTGLGSAGFSGTGWEKRGSRKGIAGSGTEAGGGRVFGRSSASGPTNRTDDRAARVSGSYVRPGAEKKAAAKMTFAAGDTVDHKTFGRGKVTKVDGDTLFVKFSKTGQTKKLLKDYAPIVKIG